MAAGGSGGDRKLQEGGNEPNFDSRFGGIEATGGTRTQATLLKIRYDKQVFDERSKTDRFLLYIRGHNRKK